MSTEPYEDMVESYRLQVQNDSMSKTIQEQWEEMEQYDLALEKTAGIMGDIFDAYQEFVEKVDGLIADYKKKARTQEKMYTLEDRLTR